jgi:hypothetical protein
VNHSDNNEKDIHTAIDLLLSNMKSKSAVSKAFESWTMKINDRILRHRARGEKMTLGHINQSMLSKFSRLRGM